MSDVLVSVRIPTELNDRLVAAAGERGRSKYIRRAIERDLGAEPKTRIDEKPEKPTTGLKRPPRPERPKPTQNIPENIPRPKKQLSPDADFLMAHLLKRARSERDACKDLDWQAGRVTRAAKELSVAGILKYQNSMMVVHLG